MDWEAFVESAQEALDAAEDIPRSGVHFRDSVQQKIEDMKDWAEENERVTEVMWTALENMRNGIERWLPD